MVRPSGGQLRPRSHIYMCTPERLQGALSAPQAALRLGLAADVAAPVPLPAVLAHAHANPDWREGPESRGRLWREGTRKMGGSRSARFEKPAPAPGPPHVHVFWYYVCFRNPIIISVRWPGSQSLSRPPTAVSRRRWLSTASPSSARSQLQLACLRAPGGHRSKRVACAALRPVVEQRPQGPCARER
eukprot:scaffold1766_cov401-Prasinococcus_capsulatus_cf.AAC.34